MLCLSEVMESRIYSQAFKDGLIIRIESLFAGNCRRKTTVRVLRNDNVIGYGLFAVNGRNTPGDRIIYRMIFRVGRIYFSLDFHVDRLTVRLRSR